MRCQIRIFVGRGQTAQVYFKVRKSHRLVRYTFLLHSPISQYAVLPLKTRTPRLRFFFVIRILDRLVKNGLFY